MRALLILGLAVLSARRCLAPPVVQSKEEKKEKGGGLDEDYAIKIGVDYHRYLNEILEVLENDKDFRDKLEKADEETIRSGKIADELDLVNHGVRTRLDEIKRKEIDRLRHLATREYEKEKGLDTDRSKIHEHLDHDNPGTFEVVDLKKLIIKTTAHLSEADRKRREEFQEYEMRKKFNQEEMKKKMNEEERKKYVDELQQLREKHKKHKPLHHPGSKQQLEEVWDKQDHMENQQFDLRTFFHLHDIDGNGVWDPVEVNTLFLKELDKIYAQGGPETDLRERLEEMERMREHVFTDTDLNKDGLISFSELAETSRTPEFDKDEGWQTLDEQRIYTDEDYDKFEKLQREEMERITKGTISPPGPGNYDPGHQQQQQQQHQQLGAQYGKAPIDEIPHREVAPPMGDPSNQRVDAQIPPRQQKIQQYQRQVPPQIIPQYEGRENNVPQHNNNNNNNNNNENNNNNNNIPRYEGYQGVPEYQPGQAREYEMPRQVARQMGQNIEKNKPAEEKVLQTQRDANQGGGGGGVEGPSENQASHRTGGNVLPDKSQSPNAVVQA